jgi:hypothetical protein
MSVVYEILLVVPVYLLVEYPRLDRHLLKPIRNYRVALQQWNRIQTQDEFHQFTYDLAKGLLMLTPVLGHMLD